MTPFGTSTLGPIPEMSSPPFPAVLDVLRTEWESRCMAKRGGSADLPLHGGHVPKWLADRMTRLGAVICEAIIHQYGRDELLRRLAHPFWFQSFGCVMGMDWHSSGITTSVIGALKRGLLSRRRPSVRPRRYALRPPPQNLFFEPDDPATVRGKPDRSRE